MTVAFRSPDADLVRRIAKLETDLANLNRVPSGATSIGIGFVRPPTKAGTPADSDYQTAPAVGTMVYDTTGSTAWFRAGTNDWRAWPMSLGYAQVTADQTGITAETDLTSLTATVTVNASRRILVRAHLKLQRTVADGGSNVYIKEGATYLSQDVMVAVFANTQHTLIAEVSLTPTAGVHTYKVAIERFGTGTLGSMSSANAPAFFLVEDIGAA